MINRFFDKKNVCQGVEGNNHNGYSSTTNFWPGTLNFNASKLWYTGDFPF